MDDREIEQMQEALRIGQAALETALNQVRDSQAQRDGMAAQAAEYGLKIAALREALDECDGAAGTGGDIRRCAACGKTWDASKMNPEPRHREYCKVPKVLADTAAAARETERRLRIEGAEAALTNARAVAQAAGWEAVQSISHIAVVDAAIAAGKWGKS